jgi:hypothetical protein
MGAAGVVSPPMKRFHIAIGVADIARSIDDYSVRLGAAPSVVVTGEYALWRTGTLNLSIRRTGEEAGALRHLGWEDPAAPGFSKDRDVNGILWEHFSASEQDREIVQTWPDAQFLPS